MEIKDVGITGTLESSDLTIHIEGNPGKGVEIELKSSVENQFGNQIRKVIKETLQEVGIKDALVRATDKGALDCTIRARLLTAINRVNPGSCNPWEVK
jgi:citrate lyase subunit gamma (acyl carrier protein)